MQAIGEVFGWLGRKAVLYVMLFVAIFAYVVWKSGDVQIAWEKSQTLNYRQAEQLKTLLSEVDSQREKLISELKQAGQAAQAAGVKELARIIHRAPETGLANVA